MVYNGNKNIDLNIQTALAKESAREHTWRGGPSNTSDSVKTKRGFKNSFRYGKAPSSSTKVATPNANSQRESEMKDK